MTTVRLSDVGIAFVKAGERVQVLRSFDLAFRQGEFLCLVGPNGSGKSTLLNLVAGVLRPDAGTVEISTEHVDRPRIGYAWQDYRSSLLPWRSAITNLTFPLEVIGVPAGERKELARMLLERHAPDIPGGQPIANLSGGQQQLISVLRSFIAEPDLVLLDEPLSALDQQRRWTLGRHIESVWQVKRPPVLMVSHDIDEAVLLADRIIMLGSAGSGEVVELANPMERPRSLTMLTDSRHLQLRNEIVEFLNGNRAERG